MSPEDRYRQLLNDPAFVDDAAQAAAVAALQSLFEALRARDAQAENAVAAWWRRRRSGRLVPVTGLYMWGGVGRGKTFLMDLFYESLPFDNKLRMHFHRFMQRVHHELKRLAGASNPLWQVADRLAIEARVICFDEFFVLDIGDAMILGELMDALFARGVTLVATSNIPPDELYANGLQRSRFLPAIDALKANTQVINVDGGTDYRLRVLERAEIYHHPLDASAEESLGNSFDALAPHTPRDDVDLEVEGRLIRARRCADDVVWFDFEAICDGPRSQNDYIELARIFHAVIISGVPVFTSRSDDTARRFISLVDEFYDHSVKLIVSAEAPLNTLYRGERFAFEFERTRSRLLEMQSHDYLAEVHRA